MKKSSVIVLIVGIFTLMTIGVSGAYAAGIDHQKFKDKEQCLNCHSQLGFNAEEFEGSVHGVFECISCHNFDADGSNEYGCVNCHTGVDFEYHRSVHSKSSNGPDCGDCHGSGHNIVRSTNPASHVYGSNLADTCGECHVKASDQYMESFHGKAVALGAENAPDCSTCHESHQVLSSDDPLALSSTGRKAELCGECHEGSALGANFVEHYEMKPTGQGMPMYWVKKVFVWLILIVVGVFLVHIELDLLHKLRNRKS